MFCIFSCFQCATSLIFGGYIYIYTLRRGESVFFTSLGFGQRWERWESPAEKLPPVSPVYLEITPGVLESAWELFPRVNEILNQSNTAAVIPCKELSPGQHLQGHILHIFVGFFAYCSMFTIFLLNRKPSSL